MLPGFLAAASIALSTTELSASLYVAKDLPLEGSVRAELFARTEDNLTINETADLFGADEGLGDFANARPGSRMISTLPIMLVLSLKRAGKRPCG